MEREEMTARLMEERGAWDVCVIGAGATGLGIAVDSAARGYRTVLLDRSDFGKGTSSRSTKLIHGGVRYLQQGNVSFVREALVERAILRENAPHLVRRLPFVIPTYAWWESPFYGIGMKVYDRLAGARSFGSSGWLSRAATLESAPTLNDKGLRGGVRYYDGQFDDARLTVALARTAADRGAVVANYCEVVRLLKDSAGKTTGVRVLDHESGREHEISARVTINAAGPFTDSVRRLDEPEAPDAVTPSQGIHLVLDSAFLPGNSAVLVPRVEKGRVLFAIPWMGRTVVGTTDTPIERVEEEPAARDHEVEFLLEASGRRLNPAPTRSDIRSIFVGVRPLVKPAETRNTAGLSRDHTIRVSKSGLVTILGGKWTTYRKMAEDCVNRAVEAAGLESKPCPTRTLQLRGWRNPESLDAPLDPYGADAPSLRALEQADPELKNPLHPALPITGSEVVWAVREEMARSVEDVLSRRTRCLVLDAAASSESAPKVAALMRLELDRDENWQRNQVEAFQKLAKAHLPA